MTIIIIFALLLVVFISATVYGRKARERRFQALQAFATQKGWALVPDMPIENFQDSKSYSLFSESHGLYANRITALMKKPFDGGEAFVFDYSYGVSVNGSARQRNDTVLGFRTPHLQLPYFALYPEPFPSMFMELCKFDDIDFESHPTFSKQFKLSGKDEEQLRNVFQPQALDFFENMGDVWVDGGGEYLFLYIKDREILVGKLEDFINKATKTYDLFRR